MLQPDNNTTNAATVSELSYWTGRVVTRRSVRRVTRNAPTRRPPRPGMAIVKPYIQVIFPEAKPSETIHLNERDELIPLSGTHPSSFNSRPVLPSGAIASLPQTLKPSSLQSPCTGPLLSEGRRRVPWLQLVRRILKRNTERTRGDGSANEGWLAVTGRKGRGF